MDFLYFLLIGLVAGWLTGQIMKGGSFGLVTNLVVGVIGAILGGFVFSLLGLAATGMMGKLVTATVGAVLLVVILRKFGRNID
ncbi:MAG: GlsB/YeaQ/YmgE family stress response membrane protein [Planctomycetaceae bacterium]|nr:GlsB/YeaQ/YmgE family stress response membrane protein [Planctomycetaceae bacterium]